MACSAARSRSTRGHSGRGCSNRGRPASEIAGVNRFGALHGRRLRKAARLSAQKVQCALLPGNEHHCHNTHHHHKTQNGLEIAARGKNHFGLIDILRSRRLCCTLKCGKCLADFFCRKAHV